MDVTIAYGICDSQDVVGHVELRVRDRCFLSCEDRVEQCVEVGTAGVVERAGLSCVAIVHACHAEAPAREPVCLLLGKLDVPDLLTDAADQDHERRASRCATQS